MTAAVAEVRGIEIVGSSVAFPCDLPGRVGTEWDNPGFFEHVFAEKVQVELRARSWQADEPMRRYGVARRQWLTDPTVHVGDLAAEAARRALSQSGLSADEIDFLVTATATPSRVTSSLAGYVAARCELTTTAFDVRAGGAAALVAWVTAVQFLRTQYRTALIVAADTPSRFRNRDAVLESSLLGDGAGALVLRRTPDLSHHGGLLGSLLETLAVRGTPWTVPGPLPPTMAAVQAGAYEFQHSDAEYDASLRALRVQTVADFQTANPSLAVRTKYLVSNAPTARQVDEERAALSASQARIISPLANHGFIGCPGPLVALHELRTAPDLQRDDVLLASAVGGGVHRGWVAWQV
jgi:3-oxoacyl-[acyl-carrier-protein] synthase-3